MAWLTVVKLPNTVKGHAFLLWSVWHTFDNSASFGSLSCATAIESRLHVLWPKSPPIHTFDV